MTDESTAAKLEAKERTTRQERAGTNKRDRQGKEAGEYAKCEEREGEREREKEKQKSKKQGERESHETTNKT